MCLSEGPSSYSSHSQDPTPKRQPRGNYAKLICLNCKSEPFPRSLARPLALMRLFVDADEKQREEDFMDLPLVVKGFSSLAESLASFTSFETLNGDNK